MTGSEITSEWIGWRGRIGGWYLASPLRRLSEILVLGDLKSAFLEEVGARLLWEDTVLDVGAGSGFYTLELAKRVPWGRVICLDLSDEMLARLRRRAEKRGFAERLQIVKGTATSIQLEENSVDLAVSNGVFHELLDPLSVLKSMIRVVRPGGRVVVTDFRDTKIGRRIGAAHRPEDHGPFSIQEMKALLLAGKLSEVNSYAIRNWVLGSGTKNVDQEHHHPRSGG